MLLMRHNGESKRTESERERERNEDKETGQFRVLAAAPCQLVASVGLLAMQVAHSSRSTLLSSVALSPATQRVPHCSAAAIETHSQ